MPPAAHGPHRLRRPHGNLLPALGIEALDEGLRAVRVEGAVVVGPEVEGVDDADGQVVVGVVDGAVGGEDQVVRGRAAVQLQVNGLRVRVHRRATTGGNCKGQGGKEGEEGYDLGGLHFEDGWRDSGWLREA